ncbi:MAG TPA: SPOR domain-containing protein [Steroidobacteraceae bacterium]|jgi:cell division septation protein DedD|nr:SPOR domain-containing protein [Steroidobacteraceae bacterium]
MKLRALTGAVLLAVSVTLVAGCSRERIDWKSAEAADTQEAYNHFLHLHPDSPLATQAHARLAQLAEDQDWKRASAADTADAYRQFLAQHPSGKWAEEARIRVENFSLDANPSPTPTATDASTNTQSSPYSADQQQVTGGSASAHQNTAASPSAIAQPGEAASAPVAQQPAPRPMSTGSASKPTAGTMSASAVSAPKQADTTAPPSHPTMTASTDAGGYGIQLGAFSTQAAALSEWKRLQVAHDAELHGLFAHAVPVTVSSGKLYRLQSPVGDEARARGICASLTKKQTPCVVVLPPGKH